MRKKLLAVLDNYFPYFAAVVMVVLLIIVISQAFVQETAEKPPEGIHSKKITQTDKAITEPPADSVATDTAGALSPIGKESRGRLGE